MKNFETTLCQDTPYHGHLVLSRDKRPMTVVVKGGLVIEAVLDNARRGVEFTLYELQQGIPLTAGVLPYEAFDEILEMIISFGK